MQQQAATVQQQHTVTPTSARSSQRRRRPSIGSNVLVGVLAPVVVECVREAACPRLTLPAVAMADDDTANLTLEEAYAVFDRFTPFSPGGPPSAKALRRLGIHACKIFYGRQSLLHRCMETQGHRLDLIQVLVEGFPGALKLYDTSHGYLPLHYAVGSPRNPRQISVDVLDYLIQQEPLALLRTTRNSRRAIPLHLATENPHLNTAMLDTLLAVFPETLHYRDAYGHQPLDGALRLSTGINLRVVRRLVQAAPVLLASVKEDGRLVLHRVLEEARETVDTHETLGIEEAALLELLVEASPGALRIQTPERLTPLALACTADLPLACVYPLLRAWPEQVTTQGVGFIFETNDWNGALLPSHLLADSLSWLQVQQWLAQDDQAATALDAVGRTALHVAVVSRAACILPMVRTLLQHNPSAASTVDQHGRVALHYAALSTHDEREQVWKLVRAAYPEALAVADGDGCLPWMYAELAQFSAVYDETLMRYPDAVDGVEDLPEEVRWDIVQVVRDEEED